MSQRFVAASRANACLLSRSGQMAGTRFPMPEGTTRIGRARDNNIVVDGSDSSMVSLHHLEISNNDGAYRARDLASTNGTWLNGQCITDAEISAKISEIVRPEDMNAELEVVFQTVENLHKAIPHHTGDWYFTGDYPTEGGMKVVNRSYGNYMEGKLVRAY